MLPDNYKKKSFLKFSVDIDTDKLIDELNSISGSYWASSYWGNVHCSIGSILLRGGNKGTQDDYACEKVYDHRILKDLPYISELINEEGPFGGAKYAFLFKMIPNGITLAHQDLNEAWKDKYRIHIPITSNEDAVLISDKRMINFIPGYAWTFDNYSMHGVVNGNTERTHLIMDVPLNDKMKQRYDEAEYIEGWEDHSKVRLIYDKERMVQSYPGDTAIREMIMTLRSYGWDINKVVAFLNHKGIPTRKYGDAWTKQAVIELNPMMTW
jgi:hypothetical protein